MEKTTIALPINSDPSESTPKAGRKVDLSHNRLSVVDGLRGFLSLWVFAGHVAFCSGAKIPLLDTAGMAVDIFMFVSGLLMAFHFRLREDREPWSVPDTWWRFYIRRFFRIAPAYYLLLMVALIGRQYFYNAFTTVVGAFPPPDAEIAAVHPLAPLSWQEVFAHFTFLFGFIPRFASSNALPDWSIGLEMQFYLAFPFLMLAFRRWGYLSATALFMVVWIVSHSLFGVYAGYPPKLLGHFPQPTFLPLKLNCFLVGILVSEAFFFRFSDGPKALLLLVGALALSIKGISWPFQVALITTMFLLFQTPAAEAASRVLRLTNRMLATRVVSFMADTSYGVYLSHNLILMPIAALLAGQSKFAALPALARFAVLLPVCAVIIYPLGFLLHRFAETPGIALGKTVLAFLPRRSPPRVLEATPVIPTPT